MQPQVLTSRQDQSVNFLWPYRRAGRDVHLASGFDGGQSGSQRGGQSGSVEARYVRRRDDRCIVYLSSKSGCALKCAMCHLTQSGQTRAYNLTIEEVLSQAETVLRYVRESISGGVIEPISGVDFSFMARGDFFDNIYLIEAAPRLFRQLHALAERFGYDARIKISTIMPQSLRPVSLKDVFGGWTPDLYYSIYSTDVTFRNAWMPKAMTVDLALRKLVDWQEESRKLIVLHGAFIAGENDDPSMLAYMGEMVRAYGLRVDWNVVRYNPFSSEHGRETDDLPSCIEALQQAFPESRVKVIDRVGADVFASCGMFAGA